MAEYDRYGQGKFWVGTLLNNFMNAKKMNMDDELSRYQIGTNKAIADNTRVENARQHDETNRINKEAVDWNKLFTIGAAKQGAQSKVAEDEAFKLYGKYGGVQRTLNDDGYSFTYTPYKMTDEQWKAKTGYIDQGSTGEKATVVGMTPDGLRLIMSDGSFKPIDYEKSVDKATPINNGYSQLLKDITIDNRNKYKNVLPLSNVVKAKKDPFEWEKVDYTKEATNRFNLLPLKAWEGVVNIGGETVVGTAKIGKGATEGVVNWWNYMMENPNKTGGK